MARPQLDYYKQVVIARNGYGKIEESVNQMLLM